MDTYNKDMDQNNLNNVGQNPVPNSAPQGIPPVDVSMFGNETGKVNSEKAPEMMASPVVDNSTLASDPVLTQKTETSQLASAGNNKLREILPLVLLSISTAAGVICAVVFFLNWQEAQTAVDIKINAAKEEARVEQKAADDAKYEEEEKKPYKIFAGPDDYGGLSLQYPKTWSAFINKDARNGGDFEAYLNPDIVYPLVNEGGGSGANIDESEVPIHALRVYIFDKSIDAVQKEFEELAVEGNLDSEVYRIGDISGTIYTGTLEEGIEGKAFIFKNADKTVEIRTDSSVFYEDFEAILKTLKLNK